MNLRLQRLLNEDVKKGLDSGLDIVIASYTPFVCISHWPAPHHFILNHAFVRNWSSELLNTANVSLEAILSQIEGHPSCSTDQ